MAKKNRDVDNPFFASRWICANKKFDFHGQIPESRYSDLPI